MSPEDSSAPAPAAAWTAPAVGRVLVPVDDGDAAAVAADHAVAVADRYGASVHALYVQDPDRLWALRNGRADAADLATDARSVLSGVADACDARDVPFERSTALGFSTVRLSRHPGEVVLDAADSVDADFLVVPRARGAGDAGVLERVAEHVLAYADQAVVSV